MLLWCRLALQMIAFKHLAPGLGQVMRETPHTLSPQDEVVARKVGNVLWAIARKLPWSSTCLVRAMAAGRLLRRRGLPYTLYLGVNRGQSPLGAHAWLRSGAVYVTGEDEANNFHPVSWFGFA